MSGNNVIRVKWILAMCAMADLTVRRLRILLFWGGEEFESGLYSDARDAAHFGCIDAAKQVGL